jgi:hypothetical protein
MSLALRQRSEGFSNDLVPGVREHGGTEGCGGSRRTSRYCWVSEQKIVGAYLDELRFLTVHRHCFVKTKRIGGRRAVTRSDGD